jgi:Nidogen-like/PEP-CTERM motif
MAQWIAANAQIVQLASRHINQGEFQMSRFLPRLGAVAVASAILSTPAFAIDLLSGFGGPDGFGELVMLPNDDGSSNRLNLPFELNFFGTTYDRFFVNNNGNITFNRALSSYTPNPFPVTNQPMIAPWWADVDTRGGPGALPGNAVYLAAPNANTVVVTWHNVGYYSSQNNKLNNFQLVLRNRSDTGTGNFDFDFRYDRLEWTTGSASGGSNGLGGIPAQAGYDDGQRVNFLTLPGSRTPQVLNLVNLSNVDSNSAGLWTFAVRNGITPGTDPNNPLLPVFVDDKFRFDFNVQLGQRIWIDPEVAVGYDYEVAAGSPSFASLIIRDSLGDGIYDLYLWDGSTFVDSGERLRAGEEFTFAAGTRSFSIRGIETGVALDPTDPTVFVVGLTFDADGAVSMTQTPLTVNVIPEPGTWAMMLLGLAVTGLAARRRWPAHAGQQQSNQS